MSIATISSEPLYRGKIVRLRADRIRLPNGREAIFEIVEHPDSVVMVPLDDANQVWFVRQPRPATGRQMLELPAGTLRPGERPDECAGRELREETGMGARDLLSIGGFYLAPGYATEYMSVYLARGLFPDRQAADEDEEITVETLPLDRARTLLERGKIEDAKTIAALAMAFPYLVR